MGGVIELCSNTLLIQPCDHVLYCMDKALVWADEFCHELLGNAYWMIHNKYGKLSTVGCIDFENIFSLSVSLGEHY